MQIHYQNAQQKTKITYGASLSASIDTSQIAEKHLVILTNQRYYEHFFEKMPTLFKKNRIDWYICRNQLYANTLEEWMSLLHFLEPFPKSKEYLFIALGNAGVVELTGFLQQVSILSGTFWVIPVSFQSYAQALVPQMTIQQKTSLPVLKQINLPKEIFVDQTMMTFQNEGKLVDLWVFIQTALLYDYSLLQRLYQEFPNPKQRQTNSLAAFIEELTQAYEERALEIQAYGKIFEEAFYLTQNGHLLSENMKRLLGFLLHFSWNAVVQDFQFHFENFYHWLAYLGFPLEIPEQIFMAEYLENVLNLLEDKRYLPIITQIGVLGDKKAVKAADLIKGFETYKHLSQFHIRRKPNDAQ